MSEAVSALKGASSHGRITVTDAGLAGMITLRGDFEDEVFASALKVLAGLDIPDQRQIVFAGDKSLAWMSPDELLLQLPYADAAEMTAKLSEALADTHALAVNVSDARLLLNLSGDGIAIRETLAKLVPVDFSPEAFAVGAFRRSRMAQIAGAIWFSSETEAHVICFRSVAEYAFNLLSTAAEEGAAVDYF